MTTAEIRTVSDLTLDGRALVTDEMSPEYAQDVLEGRALFQDAVRFLAHRMNAAGAIRWAGACARELLAGEDRRQAAGSLDAADNWLRAPGDESRWQAREAAEKSGLASPADCVAMAAFFSGDSVTPAGAPPLAPPPYMAQKMAAAGIIATVVSHEPEKSAERYRRALGIGKGLANGNGSL